MAGRDETMGGRASLVLKRMDLLEANRVLSRNEMEFFVGKWQGSRLDASATIRVQRGVVRLELEGRNASGIGFSEQISLQHPHTSYRHKRYLPFSHQRRLLPF